MSSLHTRIVAAAAAVIMGASPMLAAPALAQPQISQPARTRSIVVHGDTATVQQVPSYRGAGA